MNERTDFFRLDCRDAGATPPVLRGVDVAGRLDGVLFEMTLRQVYRNEGDRLLELVYTFPLPPRAVLLGFAATLDGRRLEGRVLPRRDAERTYEDALADGDAPVLLEAHADGLHTANIGNLKPGEEIAVEVRLAQLAQFEQGRLRLAVPSTIAPRYGSAARAGLQPQQAPLASVAADYPLAFALQLRGAMAEATVDCPTHPMVSRRTSDGLDLALADGARLDRDVVVVATPPAAAPALVLEAADARPGAAPAVRLAALPVPEAPLRAQVFLKLLVDCSGSMGGDSIASARRALAGIAAQLRPSDEVALTRFGSDVRHATKPSACTPATLARLASDIAATEANLGGTEMQRALEAVFALRSTGAADAPGDVLLVTDGEVWQVDEIVASARASRQRVFVIGVGASPSEGALRRLADATGGACEFATPGEGLEAAAARMFERLRQHAWTGLRVDWGGDVAWQDPLPVNAFGGDTLLAFAGVRGDAGPVRLSARGEGGADIALAPAVVPTRVQGDTLPRMAAAGRLGALEDAAATALAVDYQLMSRHTQCVLVHRRAAHAKAVGDAELQRVEGMLAAGWGGMGSVMAQRDADMCRSGGPIPPKAAAASGAMPARPTPAPLLKRRAAGLPGVLASTVADLSSTLAATFDRDGARRAGAAAPLAELADVLLADLAAGGAVGGLDERTRPLAVHAALRQALDALAALGLRDAVAWALVALWLEDRLGRELVAAFPDAALLRVARMDPAIASQARAAIDGALGALEPLRDGEAA